MDVIIKKSEAKEPYSFTFVNDDGLKIVKSENYSAKRSALNGIESVKKNCTIDNRYEMKESKNGKYYFNLKASNGQIIATSHLFESETERNDAIEQLKQQAPEAMENELTPEA